MHEHSLMTDLLRKLQETANAHAGKKITAINIRLGALAHISPEHFREHFTHAAAGTPLAAARLLIEQATDIHEPMARDIVLASVEIEI